MRGKETCLIFCQSAVKVSATLVCYEKEKREGKSVIIVVRNVKSVYSFLVSLQLDAKIYWFDNHILSKYWFLHTRKLYRQVKTDILSLNINPNTIKKVYFTSLCNDIAMGCYLKQFKKQNVIKLQGAPDILNNIDDYNLSSDHYALKIKVWCIIYSVALLYKLRIQTVGTPAFALDIGYYHYPLFDGSDMSICQRYKYVLPGKCGRKALVYASNYTDFFKDKEDYISVFVNTIRTLHAKGYEVYVKGHPRLGTLKEAVSFSDYEIPSYIPAEFLDISSFDMAFGLTTAALCSTSLIIKSYSILPISKLVKDERYKGWCDYLDKTSNGKVLYLKSLDDIS